MAIIFDRVNRIIEVEADEIKVNAQDLLNAIRGFEDDQGNMDIPHIAEAAGKEDLGGSVFVGITLKLINWKVKFEERETPTICDIYGGNVVAIDEYGEPMSPVEPSSNVTVTKTSSSSATLIGGGGALTIEEHDEVMKIQKVLKKTNFIVKEF